jgi:DNA-binding response OmpR family regulator
MKILIIEDEKKITNFLKKGLKSEGFTSDIATDGEEGFFMSQEGHYGVIILDIGLPKMDGIAVCQKIRKSGNTTPIIMLTAKDSVEDRVRGLDAGADDYLTKPFSFAELLARLRALKRRKQGLIGNTLKVADLELNQHTCSVQRADKNIQLSSTEYRLLNYLLENKNHTVSKTSILEQVWGLDFSPESNIVEVYIKYLREKIDKGFDPPLIHTVHGIGYKLCDSK